MYHLCISILSFVTLLNSITARTERTETVYYLSTIQDPFPTVNTTISSGLGCEIKELKVKYGSCTGDLKVGQELGKGVYGTVYKIESNKANYALKKISAKQQTLGAWNAFQNEFKREVCAQAEIAQLDPNFPITPAIHHAWYCSTGAENSIKHAYIVMDLMKSVLGNDFKGESIPSEEIQKDLIADFELLTWAGYVHNDNHWNNLGFAEPKQKRTQLFDWGFIDRQRNLTKDDRNYILAWALGILLQNMNTAKGQQTIWWKTIEGMFTKTPENKYVFGQYYNARAERRKTQPLQTIPQNTPSYLDSIKNQNL